MVHLFRYIKDNENLGLEYYADMNDAPLSDLSRQASINNENQFMDFYNSSWKYCPETGRSTGEYSIFYQSGPIDHITHVPVPVAQSSAESEYNAACTAGMALARFRVLINELLNKDPDMVPEESTLIISLTNIRLSIQYN